MSACSLHWINRISLSRVALAFVFLVCFRADTGGLLTVSVTAAIVAQITDHLDGYLVRRFSAPSVVGWVYDSFADRSFYVAALLAFQREYDLDGLIVWAFVLRELALYAIRVVVGDFESLAPGFRKLALSHAAVTRIGIIQGCLMPYMVSIENGNSLVLFLSFIFATATLLGFFNLLLLIRNLR